MALFRARQFVFFKVIQFRFNKVKPKTNLSRQLSTHSGIQVCWIKPWLCHYRINRIRNSDSNDIKDKIPDSGPRSISLLNRDISITTRRCFASYRWQNDPCSRLMQTVFVTVTGIHSSDMGGRAKYRNLLPTN